MRACNDYHYRRRGGRGTGEKVHGVQAPLPLIRGQRTKGLHRERVVASPVVAEEPDAD